MKLKLLYSNTARKLSYRFPRIVKQAKKIRPACADWWRRVHKPLALGFGLCAALLFGLGFFLQPMSSGPPPIAAEQDSIADWYISITPMPVALSVAVHLYNCPTEKNPSKACRRVPNGIMMGLFIDGTYGKKVRKVHITATIDALRSKCPPEATLSEGGCKLSETVTILNPPGADAGFWVSYPEGIFYGSAGPYARVTIPGIVVAGNPPHTGLSQAASILGESVADPQISVLNGPSPTRSVPEGWIWITKGDLRPSGAIHSNRPCWRRK